MTRAKREKRLVPIPMFVVGPATEPVGPGGGAQPRRRITPAQLWAVACALRATRQISDSEFVAIAGAAALTPIT